MTGLTRTQIRQIEVSGHWNAHNRDLCDCDEPPEQCSDCGEVYPFGLLQGKLCGDCQNEVQP